MDAAIGAVDQQADAIWDFVTDTQNAEHDSGDVSVRLIAEMDDCWRKYLLASKACLNAYNTALLNIANELETCLDNVGLWDAVTGGAVGAGVGGATGAGGTALYTWWSGPFGAVATTVGGVIGGVVGGISGAIAGPAEARDECRDTAKDDRENAKNEYEDCEENAWNEFLDCIFGG